MAPALHRSILWSGILGLALTACTDSAVEPGPELPPLDPAADWIGVYQGAGQGIVEDLPVTVPNATLTVAFDAAEVKVESCPSCVTVTLDDVFSLSNVKVESLTELGLSYVDGPVTYTLDLSRAVLGVEDNDVVRAHATYGNTGVTTSIFDMEYVLTR